MTNPPNWSEQEVHVQFDIAESSAMSVGLGATIVEINRIEGQRDQHLRVIHEGSALSIILSVARERQMSFSGPGNESADRSGFGYGSGSGSGYNSGSGDGYGAGAGAGDRSGSGYYGDGSGAGAGSGDGYGDGAGFGDGDDDGDGYGDGSSYLVFLNHTHEINSMKNIDKSQPVQIRHHTAGCFLGYYQGPGLRPGTFRVYARHIWRFNNRLGQTAIAVAGPGEGSSVGEWVTIDLPDEGCTWMVEATAEAMQILEKFPVSLERMANE